MRIDHGRFNAGMAQQLLDRSDVVTVFQQVGSKSMAERMRRHRFGQFGLARRLTHRFLDHCLMKVMPAHLSVARVRAAPDRGKQRAPCSNETIRNLRTANAAVRERLH